MSKTLLLVEDSFTIQKVVESTFTSAGFQVIVANDVRAGLEALSQASPDVILADASLPEMDGFQLCRAIRETPGYEQVPVILLTSRFTTYDEAHGRRVGVSGYLAKPFDSYTLLALVQELVNSAPPPLFDTESSRALPDEALPHSTRTPAEAHGEPPETPSTAAQPPAPKVASADISQVYQALSANLLHIVQETVQSHLATLLDALTPHIVDEVRATVNAKMPDLLEALLQQEIEKLKRVAAQNDDESLVPQPSDARRDEYA
jgi:DNA-binding response OmpR family regulator